MRPDLFFCCAAVMAILLMTTAPVMAAETNDASVIRGWDIVDIITALTTVLAVILGVISFIGYRRDQRTKFLLVTLAFSLFALKGVLIVGSDILSMRQPVFDIIASLLDFLVLGCIFLSITQK